MTETKLGLGQTLHDGDPATNETLLGDSSRSSAPAVGSGTAAAGEPSRGDTIGRFVLLGVLGSGGMGNVYSAYDPHLDRKVAIKLLRAEAANTVGIDARARLLREAQAMAKINHPNVIKVHEVGMFGDQVYVAMEFADAGTVRAWLKNATRRRSEILDVFTQAGRGLAAAHAAGLVHRDFKPDNALMEADGSVRVTDFGLVSVLAEQDAAPVARPPPSALEISLSSSTPLSQDLTRTGSIMGTPTYMAPEQFNGAPATARTDQFSFCVALYEALYGMRPFAGTTYVVLCSNVVDGKIEPPPKGSRVPTWLRRVLQRGLAVDPAARYASMGELLAALAREPMRRRRRMTVLGGGVACVAAAAAIVIALRHRHAAECSAGDVRVARAWNPARRMALEAGLDGAKHPLAAGSSEHAAQMVDAWSRDWELGYVGACEDTRVRGEQSEHLLDLRMQCLARRLDDTRATIDLVAAGGDAPDRAMSALSALPSVAPCADIASLLADVPPPERPGERVQVAAVRTQLASAGAQQELGHYAAGLAIARAALAAAGAIGYGPVTAEATLVVGKLQHQLGDGKAADTLREAMHLAASVGDTATMLDASAWLILVLTMHTSQLDRAQEVAGFAEAVANHAHPAVEILVRLEDTIALLESERGHAADAQARYEKTLALAEKELGPDHRATLTTVNQLATVLRDRGRYEEARKLYERVVTNRERVLGKEHPEVASALGNVGNIYRREGKFEDARRVYDRALAINTAALGPDHPEVGNSLNNIGTFFADQHDEKQALTFYKRAFAIFEKAYGANNLALVASLSNIGATLGDLGDPTQARTYLERALALSDDARGKDNEHDVDLLNNLAEVSKAQGKLDEAFAMFERARAIAVRVSGPESPDVVDVLLNEGTVLKRQKNYEGAAALEARAAELAVKAYGPGHPRVAMALSNLGELQTRLDKPTEALESYRRALAIFEAKFGVEHLYVSYPLLGMGGALTDLKRQADAVPVLERALAIRVKAKAGPELVAEARYTLAVALGAAPATRARAISEAQTALGEYQQAENKESVAEVKTWLAKHR